MLNPTPPQPVLLKIEFITLYILIPLLLFFTGSRLGIYIALWSGGFYAFFNLRNAPDFSWSRLWHGDGWAKAAQRTAFLRFVILAIALAVVTQILVPEKLFSFPRNRFPLWGVVMVLYPLLSIVPQELCYRSFYFARYKDMVTDKTAGMLINGAMFGFSHIILNNWIAPTFCAIAGTILAHSYQQHRSLKWAVIEHALYGNWVFTVGIGWYFFTGNWRH